MHDTVSRRGFLAATTALAASAALPRIARAQTAPLALRAATRTLDVNGRAATVYGLLNGASGQGLTLDPGQRFRVDLTNALDVETIIHWHGQIPPNMQDGVPDMPMPMLKPGETRGYDFAPQPGTHWMHSHVPTQEMQLLAAPLIVRSAADAAAARQEATLFLHDFSFKSPEEVLAEITGAGGHGAMAGMNHGAQPGAAATPGMGGMGGAMAGMDHGAMPGMAGGMAGVDHSAMGGMAGGMAGMSGGMAGMAGMAGMNHGMAGGAMAMDLNDFEFDAYLANDRTLADPEVIRVENAGRVLLRVVNAAAATTFWIDTGALDGRLVAVDGHAVQPVAGRRFGVAMAQRLDIELDLPGGEGAYPVLALREGARQRTGVILATRGAQVARIDPLGEADAPAFDRDMAQETALRAAVPLPLRAPDRVEMVMLGGAMQPYVWTINGRTWGEHIPVTAQSGQRVEIMFHNMSMMAHPMHLHGHAFQVVGVGNRRFAGAVRDTVLAPPMAMVTIAIDAGEAARWMLHCHHMPHLATGMMTEFAVSA